MNALIHPAVGVLIAVSFLSAVFAQDKSADPSAVLELSNGLWFDGHAFVERTMYSVRGVLTNERPPKIDDVIDLENGYVVPAYGEGHTHRPSTPDRFPQSSAMFIGDGIFYAMNHGNLSRYQSEFAKLSSDPGSIEARFAGAVIASPQSHGVDLWQRLIQRGSFPGVDAESLDGDAFLVIDSEEKLHKRWPEYLKTKPDFVKIMVEYSEEYVTRSKDKKYFGQSGLHPKLVPQIVKLAHDGGLRVSAHIETAADFHVVVDAGVDLIAHLPGYDIPLDVADERYLIKPSDADRAREQDVTVITTTILGVDRADGDKQRLDKIQRIQKKNLKVLTEAGVSIAVGSDQFSTNVVDEVINLSALDVFDNITLLKMLCSVTPKMIFPDRNIGQLRNGCEASFLVLKQNPLDDMQYLRAINLRVKNGRLLEPTEKRAQESDHKEPRAASKVSSLAIANCHVVSVRDGRILGNQTVVIEDGAIARVGSARETRYPASARVIDGTGQYLMPGLIDMHVHIGHESELISYLLHGVTTVCNLGGDYMDLFSDDRIDICDLRSRVAAGTVVGPRIFSAGQALDGDPRTGPYQRALSGPVAAVEAVLEQKEKGFDFIKLYDALDEPTMKAIIRAAAEADLAVIGHIPEKPGVEKTLASGIHLVAHAEEFYPAFEDVEDIETTARQLAKRVKKSGVSVIPNTAFVRGIIAQLEDLPTVLADERVDQLAPRVRRWWTPEYNWYTRRDNPAKFLADMRQRHDWLIPFVRELHKAGVPLLTGTDSAIPGALPGYSMFEEFKDLQSAGLTPLEILQTATAQPARFLREHASRDLEVGECRVGCRADLLLLDKNPLDNLETLYESTVAVIFNGRYTATEELRDLLAEQVNEF